MNIVSIIFMYTYTEVCINFSVSSQNTSRLYFVPPGIHLELVLRLTVFIKNTWSTNYYHYYLSERCFCIPDCRSHSPNSKSFKFSRIFYLSRAGQAQMQGVLNCGLLPLLFFILHFIVKWSAMTNTSLRSLRNVCVTQTSYFMSKNFLSPDRALQSRQHHRLLGSSDVIHCVASCLSDKQ